MRKIVLESATIFTLLVLLMIMALTADLAEAFPIAPSIVVYSPAPIIYTNTSVPLSVVVKVLDGAPEITSILYCLDGKTNVTLTNWTVSDNVWFDPTSKGSEFFVTSVLKDLAEGNHTLKAFSLKM